MNDKMNEENVSQYSETALASLTLPNIIYPTLELMAGDDKLLNDFKTTVKTAFSKIEQTQPTLVYEFLNELLKSYNKSINMNEIILRAEKFSFNDDYVVKRPEFKDLNNRARQLKLILSRIPDEINDRKAFLETIKEIAAAIKKKLDAVNTVFDKLQSQEVRQILDLRKRDFVRFSKLFSNTLKQYFRQGQSEEVFCAANCLISQTNLILKTLKVHCESN